jgi:hypothetical protein
MRDDIDAWISGQFPQSAKARAVWTQRARIQQQVILATSKTESRALSQEIADAVSCTWQVLEPPGWTGTQLQATGGNSSHCSRTVPIACAPLIAQRTGPAAPLQKPESTSFL